MIKLDKIFESTELLVLNKEANVLVHGSEHIGKDIETLADTLLLVYPELKGVGEPMILKNGHVIDRPGMVHRLDKDTTGVLLIAKTQPFFLFLKRQFQKQRLQKEYHAFVQGSFKRKRGSILTNIGHSANDFRKYTTKNIRGPKREAHTEYVALEDCEGVSFVKFFPKTGRTHQIRVHALAMGHPIIGDKLYAANVKHSLSFQRQALHARRVTIPFPSGGSQTFSAIYPKDFIEAFDECNIERFQ